MQAMTHFQRLRQLDQRSLAVFLCHLVHSDYPLDIEKGGLDDIDAILEEYADSCPADFACIMAWLDSPEK